MKREKKAYPSQLVLAFFYKLSLNKRLLLNSCQIIIVLVCRHVKILLKEHLI